MGKTIKQLHEEHKGKVSDQWSLYLDEWDRLFDPYQDKQIRLLEIGIQNGGSLEIWGKYFAKAETIIGCDIDNKCGQLRYDDPRISVVVGDANSDDCQERVLQQSTAFDIVVDDGSHKSSDIVRSFARYFPYLNDGGIYVVEDLHCSYWEYFEGGLYNPHSSVAFFKRLADVVNYEHWRNNKPRKHLVKEFTAHFGVDFDDYDLARIHSIEVVNSLCIIKKLSPEKNVIGKRIIVGTEECVTSGCHKFNSTSIQDISMDIRDDEHLDVFELEDNLSMLTHSLADRDGQIANLNQAVADRDGQIANLNQAVADRDGQIANLNQAVADRDGQIGNLNQAVADRDGQIGNLNQAVADRDGQIATFNRVVADLNQGIVERDTYIRKLASSNSRLIEENASFRDEISHLKLSSTQLKTENVELQIINKEQGQTSSHLLLQLDEAFLAVSNLKKTRSAMQDSYSWRITAPLRLAGGLLLRMRDTTKSILSKYYSRGNSYDTNELSDGLVGNLESPLAEATLKQPFLNVVGWIFSSAIPVVKVYASIDDASFQLITYGHERPDVHRHFPNDSASLKSGFWGLVTPKKSWRSNRINLDIWVEFQNGIKVKFFSRSLAYGGLSIRKFPLLLMYRFLGLSARQVWRALREGRMPSITAWWLELRRNSYMWMFGADRNHLKSPFSDSSSLAQDPYQQWIRTNRITSKLQLLMEADARHQENHAGAKISIVVPIYNTPRHFLEEMIESVIAQFYSNWELILVDDASTLTHVGEILHNVSKKDHRIRVVFRSNNGHISEATNDGLNVATGDFVALLDHDDILPSDALLHVVECIARHPEVDWIYTDEDKIDDSGLRFDPQFKGAWNPDMAITHNYTHHLTVIRKKLMRQAGGMRKGYEGAQDLDFFLRVAEITMPVRVRHIPQICYHWRSHEESTASQGTQKTYVFDSAGRAIQDALNRRNLSAEPFIPSNVEKYSMCLNQLRWKDSLGPGKEVTIVIPTKDRVDLLKRCIFSLCETVDKQFVKLIIMDDRSSDAATLEYLRELESSGLLQCKVVRPRRGDGTFNYARLINEAADHVATPYFLQLNNDVEAIDRGWLEDMMGWLTVDGVGVVGARLLYPDHTIQHAGVVIGPHGGLADHQFHQLPDDQMGYLALAQATRDVSAVTGACMLTSTDLFRSLGGFDEVNFAAEYNDVDFCLRAIESGKRVVYSPQATLSHLTSASRGKGYDPNEHLNFVKKYKQFQDMFYSRSIRMDSMWMPVDGGYFAHADRVRNIRILIFSHELSLTGAPIVTYEYARYFFSHLGFKVSVVSLQDGPVRQMYEEVGIPVRVLSELPDMLHMSAVEVQVSLREIGKLVNVAEDYDLVICNALTTFWGVILADLFKVPSVWHIHESVGVEGYVTTFADPSIRNMVVSSFLKANRIVFQANATRATFSEFEALGNFCTIPGGLPLARIEKFRFANSKSALRKKYGIPEDSHVVALIGTTCERKGQHVFLDAIKQIESKFSASLPDNLMFLMVGAIDGPYSDMLRAIINRYNRKNVQLIAETKDIYEYYALSDVFVCASYVESFPMVILLAMAFELPIVSTNVFGIPEIVTDQQEALLIPPGDPQSMASALHQCFNNKAEAAAMAKRAQAKLYRLFDSDVLHTKHAELARKVATEDTRATIH